jgi:CRISPR-associated protein Csd2
MFETDRSAARGDMRPRRCIAFKHESKLGNARADQLFERVEVELTNEAKLSQTPPRKFSDYVVTVDEQNLPDGVTVENWIQ